MGTYDIKKSDSSFWFKATICLLVLSVGVLMQGAVIKSNDCKMPTLGDGDSSDQGCYLEVQSLSEAKLGLLGDIIRIRSSFFSIGDLTMIFGVLLWIIVIFKKGIQLRRIKIDALKEKVINSTP